MTLEDPSGRLIHADIVEDYAGGCFDDALVMIGDAVLLPADLEGWKLVEGSEQERGALAKSGYASLMVPVRHVRRDAP